MTHRILIIEDNADMARLVQMHLADIECDADIVHDGAEGAKRFAGSGYELVVLDLMLPSLDGLAVCRELRRTTPYVPILMLTAKSAELDRVIGLETGADDYLTKPFSIPELQARIKALLRRARAFSDETAEQTGQSLTFGSLCIDSAMRRVRISSRDIELTAKEFDLLFEFARHPGRVYTRSQLLDKVWGYGHDGYEHTVNSHINRLRAKIEHDPANPDYVLTVWGVGYKFNDAAG